MGLYPLIMVPHFRHGDETPWGGSMLGDIFLKNIPDDRTGESLEISALPGCESVVKNGEYAGKTLTEMIELWQQDLTGFNGDTFPLLLKLLDARDTLSVQVHPDDAYAAENDQKLGKTEAWIVLNAEPGAKIVLGLNTGDDDLASIVREGRLEYTLNWIPVHPGDVFYIPSGLVHALGSGVQCYEIQQSSDATYRFWDWNRTNASGEPRELHTQKALDVSNPKYAPAKLPGTTVLCKGGSRTYYISDRHFELCRLNLSGTMPLEHGRMLFLTPLMPCRLRWDGGALELNPFESALIPAALEGVSLEGEGKILMSSLPDRARLRETLGYRAENVAGLMED